MDNPIKTPRDSKYPLPPRASKVEITPEMATDWLDTRNGDGANRRLSMTVASKYAEAIRRGEWKETHQGLAFDTEGWTLDGQHRLQAISLAGITVTMWVFPDLPRDTFDVLDVGRRRVASHLLKQPNATVLASAVRFLAVADGIKDPRSTTAAYAELTNVETLDLVRRGGFKLEQAARTAWRIRSGARITPSPMAAMVYQALHTEAEVMVDDFVEGLVTGANLDKNDPRLRLRNAFNANPTQRAASLRTPSHPYALVVKAWNAFVQRKEIGALAWRMDEEVPRVLGYTPTLKDKD